MATQGASSIEPTVYMLVIHHSHGDNFRLFPTENGLKMAIRALKRGYTGVLSYEVKKASPTWETTTLDGPAQKRLI